MNLTMNKRQQMSGIFLVIGAFALPMFSALAMFALSASALCALIFDFAQVKQTLRESKLAQLGLALFAVIAASALYSSAPTQMMTKVILAYREFALIGLTIGIVTVLPQYKKWVVNALILSLSIVVVLSCLDAYAPLPFSKSTLAGAVGDHFIFAHHINQNVMSSFLVLLLLLKATDPTTDLRWQWRYWAMALVAVCDVLFLVKGRTGILTLAWNLLVFGYFIFSVKQRWLAVIVTAMLVSVALSTDNPLNRLAQRTVYEVQAHQERGEDTSAGLRLAFWQDTWAKIEQKPILGYGVGSYQGMYDLDKKNPDKPGYWAGKVHPHNELFYIWFQAGILAAMLFLGFVATLWMTAFKTQDTRDKMLQYSVAGMLVIYGALDVPLLNHIEGMFFWLIISVFFAKRGSESAT